MKNFKSLFKPKRIKTFLLMTFFPFVQGGYRTSECSFFLLSDASYFAYVTCTSAIIHLICPPKFCITFFFSFLLGITAVPRETENNAYAKFPGANKVHGRCASCA